MVNFVIGCDNLKLQAVTDNLDIRYKEIGLYFAGPR